MRIALLDSHGKIVNSGIGSLDITVNPGFYELEYCLGSTTGSQLLALEAGTMAQIFAKLELPTTAPIGNVAIDVAQQEALNTINSGPPTVRAMRGGGELVVFLLPESESDSEPAVTLTSDTFEPFALIGQQGQTISELDRSEVRLDGVNGYWACARARVQPGGYALRFMPPKTASDTGSRVPRRTFDQSIWIEEGWQTILFIPQTSFGPRPQAASVHMVRVGETWSPHAVRTLMLESMLVCLRDGKPVVPSDFLTVLSDEEQTSPILGIVGAHSAFLCGASQFDTFDQIMKVLVERWPQHPDVIALQWIRDDRAARILAAKKSSTGVARTGDLVPPARDVTPVGWPPMMLASYQGLLKADANWEVLDIIADHSLAESAATGLLVGGLWSSWQPVTKPLTETGPVFSTRHLGLFGASLGRLVNACLRLAGQPVTTSAWELAIGGWETSDPTSLLLKEYLKQCAANTDARTISEFVAKLSAPDISLATGLPVRGVQRVLSEIKAFLETGKRVPATATASRV